MITVNNLLGRLKTVDVKDISFQSVSETKEVITDIQREQMFQGLNSKGNQIGSYASYDYAVEKNDMNPLPGFGIPDLKLTGAFYAGFGTEVTPEEFSTSSSDEKNADLTAKYNPFGLNKLSKTDYADKLRPVLVKNVRNKLSL